MTYDTWKTSDLADSNDEREPTREEQEADALDGGDAPLHKSPVTKPTPVLFGAWDETGRCIGVGIRPLNATYHALTDAEASRYVRGGCAALNREPVTVAPTPKAKPARIALECLECSKRWKVSANAHDPSCPRCGGVDWDVVS